MKHKLVTAFWFLASAVAGICVAQLCYMLGAPNWVNGLAAFASAAVVFGFGCWMMAAGGDGV